MGALEIPDMIYDMIMEVARWRQTYLGTYGTVQEMWNGVFEGSKVDVLNKNAESPLHLAIRMMHADIVHLLVNHGIFAHW